jgi:hypothetical protein
MNMGLREYARHKGVAPSAVEKALKSGRIQKEPDGTIDPVKADAAWERNTSPAQQRKPLPERAMPTAVQGSPVAPPTRQPVHRPVEPEAGPNMTGVPNYQISRAIRETYNAKLARLEYEEKNGKLLNAEDVANDAFALASRVRDRILAVPSRVSSMLASETDSKVIERLLTQELRNALEEIAQS